MMRAFVWRVRAIRPDGIAFTFLILTDDDQPHVALYSAIKIGNLANRAGAIVSLEGSASNKIGE